MADSQQLARDRSTEDVGHDAVLIEMSELRAARRRLVTTNLESRRQLERDLHDGLQPQLVALKAALQATRLLASRGEPVDGILSGLVADTQDTIATLRDLVDGLYPPVLATQGLAAGLRAYARRAPVRVEVAADGLDRYAPEVEAAVYFCSLEAVQNAVRHANPSCIAVRLEDVADMLVFTVSDDGSGFDVRATPEGCGRKNLRDRVAAFGGEVRITSIRGEGTVVTGHVPLPAT